MNTLVKRRIPAVLALAALVTAGLAAPSQADTQGNLTAWGTTSNALSTVPGTLAQKTVVGVGSAVEHTLAVTDDGRVTSWGATDYDAVPNSVQGATTAVAAGTAASFALSTAGKVTEWGVNGTLRTDPVLATLNGGTVTSLSVRDTHAVALTSTGQVTSWDINGTTADSLPSSLTGTVITAVAAGNNHSLALTNNGKVIAWDRNPLDLSGATNVPSSLDTKTVVAIAAGTGYSMALTDDGKITAWGGLLGINSLPSSLTGKVVTAIAAGPDFAEALLSDGTVVAWGNGTVGQTSVPAGLTGVTGIAAGTATGYAWAAPTSITLYGAITVSGTARVGQTLTAGSTVTSTPTTSMSGAWLRDGTPISGATGSSYTLVNADAGHTISCRITASKTGFTDATKTSAGAGPVDGGQITVPTPTITGTAVVEGTLTGSVSGVSPSDATLSYAWTRGATTVGTSATYSPTSADAGSALTLTVTATKAHFDTQTSSMATSAVARGTFGTAPTATVSGSARVGQTLTASTTASSPTGTLTGQWLRDGAPISGATASTYAVVNADASHALGYRVTATRPGFDDAVGTSPTVGPVDGGQITLPPPTITGSAKVDGTLTGTVTGVDPTDAGLTYAWTRGSTSVGSDRSYTPTADDAGATLTLTVTATRAHYDDATSSATTGVVAKGTFGTPAGATVTGTAKVGSTLTATTTASSPAGTLTGRWLRDGAPVSGATGTTYQLTNDDAGHAISYRVTASKAGYDDATTTSATVGPVTGGVITLGTVSISGDPVVDGTLTGSVDGLDPADATRAWVWKRDGTVVGSGSTYAPTASDVGARLTATLTVSKSSFDDASGSATTTVDVARATFSGSPSVTVSGTAKVGSTLTATTTASTPSGTVSGRWLRDGEPIDGATGTTYDLTNDDAGHAVRYRVTSSRAGYADATVTSDATDRVTGGVITLGDVSISGDVAVGSPLTASVDGVDPSDADRQWVWSRAGQAVGTGATYTPVAADLGATLTATVTVSKPFYDDASDSAETSDEVAEGTFQSDPTVSVSGTAKVGSTLTATTTASTPSGTLSGQWLRDGQPIDGATGSTYRLTPGDRGHAVSYRVTSRRAGYADATVTSDPTGSVAAGQITLPSPTLTGSTRVGSTLSVALAGIDPDEAALTYAWKRGTTTVGTGSAYTPTAEDLGATLTVTVTATADGYDDQTTSLTTGAIAKGVFGTYPGAGVTGTAKVGSTLTATLTAADPAGTTTGRWLRDGAPISGATGTTYTLTNDDAGAAISYEVTATKDGYDAAVTTSDPVGPITGGKLTVAEPVVTGSAVVDGTLTATVDVAPSDATVAYQWKRDGTVVGTNSVYSPTAADAGSALTLVVTVSKPAFDTVERSVELGTVAKAHFTTGPTAGITGTLKVGQTLTATGGTPSPAPDGLEYQWYSDGHAIDGATGPSFTLTLAQVRKPMSVRVTARKAGYDDSVDTSGVTADVVTNLKPSVTFTTDPDPVREGGYVTLSWVTDGGTVVASGDWSGTLAANGTKSIGPLALGTTTYVLTVTNENGTTVSQVTAKTVRAPVVLPTVSSSGFRLRGRTVIVKSAGLKPSEPYTITIGGTKVASGLAGPDGSVSRRVRIPTGTAEGTITVTVTGSYVDRAGSTTLKVLKNKRLKPTVAAKRVRKGKRQTVKVTSLAVGERVTVYYRGHKVSRRGAVADSTGTWTGTFNVGRARGVKIVKVRGQFKGRRGTVRFRVR